MQKNDKQGLQFQMGVYACKFVKLLVHKSYKINVKILQKVNIVKNQCHKQ